MSLDCGAEFSACRQWRYRLWRRWSAGPTHLYLMLNPSTADELANDPTVERCERRARADGAGRLVVCNIFAWRSTDPRALRTVSDPVGPGNDAAIVAEALGAELVVCGWGTHGRLHGRGPAVARMLREAGCQLHALRITAEGHPGHPLYIGYGQKPQPWEGPA